MWAVPFFQGPDCTRVLAARRAIKSGNTELERTPMLLPSFSSKGFPKVAEILKRTKEVISGPILLSTYDLHYQNVSPSCVCSSVLPCLPGAGRWRRLRQSVLTTVLMPHPRCWMRSDAS